MTARFSILILCPPLLILSILVISIDGPYIIPAISPHNPTMAYWVIFSFRLILSIILLQHINGVSNIDSEPDDYGTSSSSAIDIGEHRIKTH